VSSRPKDICALRKSTSLLISELKQRHQTKIEGRERSKDRECKAGTPLPHQESAPKYGAAA
jgi:hypothetical protein